MKNGARKAKRIVAVIFILIGALFGFVIPKALTANAKVCTREETALVVDLIERNDGSGSAMYSPVYEVYVDGETKTLTSNAYSNFPPAVGDEVTVMLNPDNTDQFYVPGGVEDFIAKIFSIVGYVFLGVGVIVLFIRVR